MNRRTFLGFPASSEAHDKVASGGSVSIIDTHIHLFDPTRPQGIPWPEKDNKDDEILYQPALPGRYRQITGGLGIVGAIKVECSPWLEDNQWVLDVAASDPLIVGTVGDLEPGTPDFLKHLERFHQNPLFRGIRYGNLWGRNLANDMSRAGFVDDLQALADADLALDTANQDATQISALIRITDKIPNLRVVIDHLPQMDPPTEPQVRTQVMADLQELAARPHVYVKLSEVLRRIDGQVHYDLAFYRSRLDEIWGIFGEDRIMYGSDWPNSDRWGSYQQAFDIVNEYVAEKGRAVAEKFFWRNSILAYRWVKRAANQPEMQ